MNDQSPRNEMKSLAQALYEANPAVGWNPKWDNLEPMQRMWWINYENLVRNYLEAEARNNASDSHQVYTDTSHHMNKTMNAS
jgi:hypothetical protein